MNKKLAAVVVVVVAAGLVIGALAVRGSSDRPTPADKAGGRVATGLPVGQEQGNADSASGGTKGGPHSSATTAAPVPDKGVSTLADGAKLAPVEQPPTATLAMLEARAATAGSRYKITFRPYGSVRGGGVVVSVSKCEVEGHFKKTVDLTKRNVLLRFGSPEAERAVTKGGDYTGLVELRDENGMLVPRLLSAKKDG